MAKVWECGHAWHFFEIKQVDVAPHIHIHFLTDKEESEAIGYCRVEFCCHGCSDSLLVLCDKETVLTGVGETYTEEHLKCALPDVDIACLDFRASLRTLDLRTSKRRGKLPQVSAL